MILVDTSVWINLFSRRPTFSISSEQIISFATCLPVIQDVVQGLTIGKNSDRAREGILALPCLCNPLSIETVLHAADIFRHGRSRGYTIRSSYDCLIAAIAIESQLPVLHLDRDFSLISKYTTLQSFSKL